MSKSLTTNEFINKANIIHNNKYCATNEFKLLRISYLNFNKIKEILISLLLC